MTSCWPAAKAALALAELPHSPMAGAEVSGFTAAAAELGFTPHVADGIASQVIVRLLIQTGLPLSDLTDDELGAARVKGGIEQGS